MSLTTLTPPVEDDRLLSTAEGQAFLGIGNSKWWEIVKHDPAFPKAIELGGQKRWRSELRAYAESRRIERATAE